jgi:quercetin dioxygenase-like cupin family protein
LSSSILTLAPGQQPGWRLHEAPLYFYVMSGCVEVSYERGITKTYDAGTAVIEAIEIPHKGRSPGATDTAVLVVNIGAEGVPNTVTL